MLDPGAAHRVTFQKMQTIKVRIPAAPASYEIKVSAGLLRDLGGYIRAAVGSKGRRAALISNRTVFGLFGRPVVESLREASFDAPCWLMPEGERHKSLRSFAQVLEFLSKSRLERNDCVVALGGGVVGDLAGFAAATYLRGISFIQVPTTLLSQIDASVGGKTGINLSAGKNLVGSFHQPRLVMIDINTLQTLTSRELTAGWCEAVKQGAVGDRRLFDRTVRVFHLLQEPSKDGGLGSGRDKSQTDVC